MTLCLPATSPGVPFQGMAKEKFVPAALHLRGGHLACAIDDQSPHHADSARDLSCSSHRSPLSYRVRCARNSAPPSLMGSALVSRRSLPGRMLINLLPDFFAVLDSTDRVAAYQRYFEAHRRILEPYWHNYVVDPDGPHFADVVRATALADRSDLRDMLDRTDVVALARATEERCAKLLAQDVDVDIVLMVGVCAANAGELVIDGRAVAFVCLEHFTSVANPDTQGLGRDPELIPLWLAHEFAHAIRYTSPTSRSEMRAIVEAANG